MVLKPGQTLEQWREAFEATLREAEAEADRDGFVELEDVMAELDRIIAEA